MSADEAKPSEKISRNADGSFTKETRKRAMKAFRRRLKLTRLDDESRLGHDPMSRGVAPPEQYPPELWEELAQLGRLIKIAPNLYEIVEI